MKKIPNILTLIRLAVMPSFILMLFYGSITARWIFLILFAIASFTDFFDGYIARKYKITSNFGRVFDSIADKSLIIIVCIMVLLKDIHLAKIIIIPIMVTILRELIISGVREGLSSKIVIKSNLFGKYKTTFQMLSLGFLIIGGYDNSFYENNLYIGIFLLYISVILSLTSGFQYIMQSYKTLMNEGRITNEG